MLCGDHMSPPYASMGYAGSEVLRRYVKSLMVKIVQKSAASAQAQMYPQAATCYEELLMHQPASAATHVQYADVLYTVGGAANYQTARTHYSAAIEISSGRNVRALYGLCASSAQLRKADSRVRTPVPQTSNVDCASG